MYRTDSSGNRYIFQDGKHYYLGLDGKWRAERDIFGNEIVERSLLTGQPVLDLDIFGNQVYELDAFGRPLVRPETIG